jgi:hypothetical protein
LYAVPIAVEIIASYEDEEEQDEEYRPVRPCNPPAPRQPAKRAKIAARLTKSLASANEPQ